MPNSVEQAVQIEANRSAISAHEQLCAERYTRIDENQAAIRQELETMKTVSNERMKKLEWMLYAIAAAVLLGPGAAAEILKKMFGL